MLSHDWMRQRDRQIRRAVRDSKQTEDEGASPQPDGEGQWEEQAVDADAPAPGHQVDLPDSVPGRPEAVSPDPEPDAEPAHPTFAPVPTDDAPVAQVAAAPAEPESPPWDAGVREPSADMRRTPLELPDDIAAAHPSMRQRLEAVLSRQQQLPLDIDARRAFTAGVEDSPRETREELVRRLLDPTLTLQEAAVLLDVCPTTVRRYTDRGVLRCFRTPGNQRRFHLSDVLDLMERQSRPL